MLWTAGDSRVQRKCLFIGVVANHCIINNSMTLVGFDAHAQAQVPLLLSNFRLNPSF